MSINHAALAAEIQNDPLSLGYADRVSAGDDAGLASLLNLVRDSITVKDDLMSRSDFQLAVLPAVLGIDALSGALKAKWERIFQIINASETVRIGHPSVAALLTAAVTDGLLTQETANAVGNRKGSRAEALFGVGTSLTHLDISIALRNAH